MTEPQGGEGQSYTFYKHNGIPCCFMGCERDDDESVTVLVPASLLDQANERLAYYEKPFNDRGETPAQWQERNIYENREALRVERERADEAIERRKEWANTAQEMAGQIDALREKLADSERRVKEAAGLLRTNMEAERFLMPDYQLEAEKLEGWIWRREQTDAFLAAEPKGKE